MAVDLHGTLDRAQLGCLASLMQRTLYVASSLPNTEEGFPTIKIVPSQFITKMMNESISEEIKADLYVVDEHAAMVVDKDPRLLCKEGLSESMKDGDPDNAGYDEDRMTTMVLWLRNKVRSTEHTRELLNSTRDIIIRAIRDAMPEDSDAMDHMIAGAYIRTMMVVNSPEIGPNAQTAIFSVASFEDHPQTLVFKFVAGAPQPDNSSAEEFDFMSASFPYVSSAMIALKAPVVEWLGSPVALHSAGAPQTTDSDSENSDGLKDEIQSWEESSSVQIPSVTYRTMSEDTASQYYAGPTTVVQVPEQKKTPYCDQLWDSVSTWVSESCYCFNCYKEKPTQEQELQEPQKTPAGSRVQSRQPSRTLVQPLIR